MLKTYQFKTHCEGDSHGSKTANILPGLMIKQSWTSLRLQAKYSRLRLFNLGEMSCFKQHNAIRLIISKLCVYTYTHIMIFFLLVCSYSESIELCSGTTNPKSAPWSAV